MNEKELKEYYDYVLKELSLYTKQQIDYLNERIEKLEEQTEGKSIKAFEPSSNSIRSYESNEIISESRSESRSETYGSNNWSNIIGMFAGSGKLSEDGTAYKTIRKVLKMRHIDFSGYKVQSNVKAIMREKKYTQDELANLINVNRSTIVNILNGKGVSLENAFKLSSILETPIERLFEYVSEGENDE